jgi:hypothetical protein
MSSLHTSAAAIMERAFRVELRHFMLPKYCVELSTMLKAAGTTGSPVTMSRHNQVRESEPFSSLSRAHRADASAFRLRARGHPAPGSGKQDTKRWGRSPFRVKSTR